MIGNGEECHVRLEINDTAGGLVKECYYLEGKRTSCEIGFMCAKSYYEGTVSTGVVNITMDLDRDVSNYHVVIVEDIVDTGRTLNDIVKLLNSRGPISMHVVTLLDKPSRRLVNFNPDISLFTIPDHFVIGYGLDCGEYFRNLPYIAEYTEE